MLYSRRMCRVLCTMVCALGVGVGYQMSDVMAMTPGAFVTTWYTDAANETITIPIYSASTYSFDVDCEGDGTFEYVGIPSGSCVYSSSGAHQMQIRGTFPYFFLEGAGSEADKLMSIDQWGTGSWTSMGGAFKGATNLKIKAKDKPDLSHFNTSGNMASMFQGATNLEDLGGKVKNWDLTNVTDISSIFADTNFNSDLFWGETTADLLSIESAFANNTAFTGDISDWNTSNVVEMISVFEGATKFNGDISGWHTSNVEDMTSMFSGATTFNGDISRWDVGQVSYMVSMFQGATSFNQPIGKWDTTTLSRTDYMFQDATAFDQNLGNWNVASLLDSYDMFSGIGVGLSRDNYDNTLIGWSGSVEFGNMDFNGGNSTYCRGAAAHAYIFQDASQPWTLQGDGGIKCIDDITLTNTGVIAGQKVVGDLDIDTPLDAPSVSYTLSVGVDDNDLFTIDSNGQLSFINRPTAGTYTVTVNAEESSMKGYDEDTDAYDKNSTATKTFTITVESDDELPVVTLIGSGTVIVDIGGTYTESGATWTDNADGTGTITVPSSGGQVDTSTGGTYTLTYEYTDFSGNTGSAIRTVTVQDISGPELTLNGSGTITINAGTTWTDPGADWIDNVDGTGTLTKANSGSVDTSKAGTYVLTYQTTDKAGNPSNIVKRTVIVQTNTPSPTSGGGGGGGGGGTSSTTTTTTTAPTTPSTGTTDVVPTLVPSTTPDVVSTTVFNPTIAASTCFVPRNALTINQGNDVSIAFLIAHQMLYSYELTRFAGTRDYAPYNTLTREEAARFMTEFAKNVLCRTPERVYENNFSDLDDSDPTLTEFVRESYEYQIFNGDKNGKFRPRDLVTTDELAAVLVRLVTNKIFEEPSNDWAGAYRAFLDRYAYVSELLNTTRENVAEVIYDLYRNNDYVLGSDGYVIEQD